jgi:diguanylate cyclase (GGDEF)-like protein
MSAPALPFVASTRDRLLDPRLASPTRLAALEATGLLDGQADAVLDRVARLGARVLGVPVCLASLVTDRAQYLPGLTGQGGEAASSRRTALSHSFCRHVVLQDAPFVVTDAARDVRVVDDPAREARGVTAYAGVPLRTAAGETLGALCAISPAPVAWTDDELDTLHELARIAMAEIELRLTTRALHDTNRRLHAQLLHDDLTGLLNRRGMLEAARDALARARARREPFVVGVIELAGLRAINATAGFAAADALLVEMATVLTETFRAGDLVARFCGNEFAVLVVNASAEDLPFIVARLEAALDVHNGVPGRDALLVARTGFSAWDPSAPVSIATLLQSAAALVSTPA